MLKGVKASILVSCVICMCVNFLHGIVYQFAPLMIGVKHI